MMRSCLTLLIVVALAGCGAPDSDESEPEPDAPAVVDTVQAPPDSVVARRIDEMIETGYALGSSEETIRDRFGEPEEVARIDTTNRHTGETDQLIRLRYPNMAFEVYRVSANERELLSETVVEGEAIDEWLPLSAGVSRSDIREYLGEPDIVDPVSDTATILQYETRGIGAPNLVNFHMIEDRLQQVQWIYYVD